MNGRMTRTRLAESLPLAIRQVTIHDVGESLSVNEASGISLQFVGPYIQNAKLSEAIELP